MLKLLHKGENIMLYNTSALQLASLNLFMAFRDYEMVYTDSSIFFRGIHNPNQRVSFERAVKAHNDSGKNASNFVIDQHVKQVKLQRTKNVIKVQSHKVKIISEASPAGFEEYALLRLLNHANSKYAYIE